MLIKDPQIDVKNVAITSASLQEVSLNVTLDVNNPNPVGITIKSLLFDVYYQQGDDWVAVGHGEGGGYVIKPGQNEISVPVTIKLSELLGAGISTLVKGEITIKVNGTAIPDMFGLNPKVPFSRITTIPLKR